MLKQVDLFCRKPGMSPEDFKTHYETRHAPLLMGLIPRFAEYRRNFVLPNASFDAAHIEQAPPPPAFDVITEVWFEDRETLDALIADLKDPAIGDPIARDEENFFDRTCMTIFEMEEHKSDPVHLGAHGGPDDGSMVKMICMLKRRPGMSREAFIDYYETRHAPLAAKHLRMIARYHRSYMIPGSGFDAGHIAEVAPLPEVDVMTEMWFRNMADYEELGRSMADPDIGAMFREDEAKLFDRSFIQMFLVDERVTPRATLDQSAVAKGYKLPTD